MCISQYGYEPKLLIRETEERLKGVRFAKASPKSATPALSGLVAAWIKSSFDDLRRMAGLRGISA